MLTCSRNTYLASSPHFLVFMCVYVVHSSDRLLPRTLLVYRRPCVLLLMMDCCSFLLLRCSLCCRHRPCTLRLFDFASINISNMCQSIIIPFVNVFNETVLRIHKHKMMEKREIYTEFESILAPFGNTFKFLYYLRYRRVLVRLFISPSKRVICFVLFFDELKAIAVAEQKDESTQCA